MAAAQSFEVATVKLTLPVQLLPTDSTALPAGSAHKGPVEVMVIDSAEKPREH